MRNLEDKIRDEIAIAKLNYSYFKDEMGANNINEITIASCLLKNSIVIETLQNLLTGETNEPTYNDE